MRANKVMDEQVAHPDSWMLQTTVHCALTFIHFPARERRQLLQSSMSLQILTLHVNGEIDGKRRIVLNLERLRQKFVADAVSHVCVEEE